MAYVALGLILLFGAFSLVGVQAIRRSTELVFRQRLDLAQALAGDLQGHIDFLAVELERSSVRAAA